MYDQYATNPKVHITVAYLFDPRDAGQQTPVHTIKLADSLVDQLNDQFKGKAVDVSGMSFDDNGFQYYGMIRP
ncbi:MAG: hypothetical protein EBT03_10825 [Betaproteobacteria bacterium]|nr:hypothetical protein [Betaproteobacteria bacterium]NCA17393.1 hypothetical protein [Betaproteobacteria bacterium]